MVIMANWVFWSCNPYDLTFSGWNSMSKSCFHSVNWSRSFCSAQASCGVVMGLYITVPSAKCLTVDFTLFGRSFIYMRNKIGPGTDTWGTPDVTFLGVDAPPSTTTFVCYFSESRLYKNFPPNPIPLKLEEESGTWNLVESLCKVHYDYSVC